MTHLPFPVMCHVLAITVIELMLLLSNLTKNVIYIKQ